MTMRFLSHFTPSIMAPTVLEATFVQREALARRVIALIRDSALTPTKHHSLLIGSRGIGKTHFVSIVYHRLRSMSDLQGCLCFAWLREEAWGITSFLDLVIRVLQAVMEDYQDAILQEQLESLYALSPDAAERAAIAILEEYVGSRTLLVVMENLDSIFGNLGDHGQKRLRSYLQESAYWTILATSQSLSDDVSLQTSPFYGFFQISRLKELSLDDAIRLLTSIATHRGDDALAAFIQTPAGRARVRAVSNLAGGNPRVYVILSQFLTRESLDELVEPVMSTLDDLTPYYQERMASLSPQQRKITEMLCDCHHAIPVKEIAQRCFITHQTASSQLRILRDIGYVRSIALGRESYYEIQEPLMRLCVEAKKHRGEPIRLFIEFLRLWYSRTELQQRLARLQPDAVSERDYLLRALQASSHAEDPRVASSVHAYRQYMQQGDADGALKAAEELAAIRGDSMDYARLGVSLLQHERYGEALEAFNRAVELDPSRAETWGYRGVALEKLDRIDEALLAFDRSVEIDESLAWIWDNRGVILGELDRYDEALVAFDRTISLNQFNAQAWYNRSVLLAKVRRYDESLTSCERAISLGADFSLVAFQHAECLLALDQWGEGCKQLDRAMARYAHEFGDTEALVRNVFLGARDPNVWRSHIGALIEVYSRHDALTALGHGLVRSIAALDQPITDYAAAQIWLAVWCECAAKYVDLQLPLRLLNAAVHYRKAHDARILLELAVEERMLLEPLLESAVSADSRPSSDVMNWGASNTEHIVV